MLTTLARVIHRRRITVLTLSFGFIVAMAASAFGLNGGLFGKAVDGGFDYSGSESSRALAADAEAFGRTDYDVLVTYTSPGAFVDDAGFTDAVTATLDAAAATYGEAVEEIVNPLATPDPQATGLVSPDGATVVALVRIAGEDDYARSVAYSDEVADALVAPSPVQTLRGGNAPANVDIGHQVEDPVRHRLGEPPHHPPPPGVQPVDHPVSDLTARHFRETFQESRSGGTSARD